jgi:hypothetical protein
VDSAESDGAEPAGTVSAGAEVFLSYARSDDEPFVALLRDYLINAGLNVWFDRASMPSRGIPSRPRFRMPSFAPLGSP